MENDPSALAVPLRVSAPPTRSQTVELPSTLPAGAVKVAVVSLVRLSVLLVPVSLAASRSGVTTGAAAEVSRVTDKFAESVEVLPALSI
ncbi:MAG: hypothetical protein BWY71_02185 [Planctomycetes bacterium ADurb.Bin412]|nr:MAG: hypothetical protein BWY71_02185 [Planctomycetes bacterium ADurb.Bin412]